MAKNGVGWQFPVDVLGLKLDASADPTLGFFEGALDWRRTMGRVLPLETWEMTEAHRAAVAKMTTMDGLRESFERDGPTLLAMVIAVMIFRWLVIRLVVTPLGRRVLPVPTKTIVRRGKRLTPEQQIAKTLDRFECTAWEVIFYSLSASFGMSVYLSEDWTVWPSTQIWLDWPLQELDPLFRFYYLGGLAFYIAALLSLLFFDKPRSDFVEYLIHHLVTVFLIAGSFYVQIYRYGVIILLLHDVGDVPLNLAKTFKYLGPKYDALTNTLFVVFVLVFIATRLMFLPFLVIPSGYWEAMQIVPSVPGFSAMNSALAILQLLHCFWFTLIVKAVWLQITSGVVDDIREEGEAGDNDKED